MCHSKVDAHRGVFGNTGEAGESSIKMLQWELILHRHLLLKMQGY